MNLLGCCPDNGTASLLQSKAEANIHGTIAFVHRKATQMKLIVCIDDQNGMAFNHRRQSQDRVLVERIEDLAADSTLRMAPYSKKLFGCENTVASSSYLADADGDDYCFVELDDVKSYEDKIQKVIIFRWNRHYPSDVKFEIDLSNWHLVASEEFPGSSHLKITMEVYER